jgi:hypothetical protein
LQQDVDNHLIKEKKSNGFAADYVEIKVENCRMISLQGMDELLWG